MLAAQSGSLESVQALLQARAKVQARDEDCMRPLHFAAASGELTVLEALLEARADPEALDRNGQGVLDHIPWEVRCLPGEQKRWADLLTAPKMGQDCEADIGVPALEAMQDAVLDTGGVGEAAAAPNEAEAEVLTPIPEVLPIPDADPQSAAPSDAPAANGQDEAIEASAFKCGSYGGRALRTKVAGQGKGSKAPLLSSGPGTSRRKRQADSSNI
jgi:hypothetical protein